MTRLAAAVAFGAVVLGVVCACSSTPIPSGTPAADTTPAPATEPPFAVSVERSRLAVIQAVNEDPDNFGGVLVTQDGSIVVFFVGSNAGRAEVESKVGPLLRVEWRHVERSYTDLMRILREISDRNIEGVFALSIDVATNQVSVRVTPPELVIRVSLALAPEYGDAVVVVGVISESNMPGPLGPRAAAPPRSTAVSSFSPTLTGREICLPFGYTASTM